jgi:hypothetical protein
MATTEERMLVEKRTEANDVEQLERMWSAPAAISTSRPPRIIHTVLRPQSLFLLWLTTLVTIIALEPASEPDVQLPMWAAWLGFAFFTAFFAAVHGLAQARPWGFKASGAAALLGMGMAVACTATGHHGGISPYVEFAAFSGLGALTLASALRR